MNDRVILSGKPEDNQAAAEWVYGLRIYVTETRTRREL